MSYLDTIVANKREELKVLTAQYNESYWEQQPYFSRKCNSMRKSLELSDTGIISEFKRKSPSKGFIKEDGDPAVIIPGYEENGASGVSILQDRKFFAGGYEDMLAVRSKVNLPLLFKEFIVDEYQLTMAKGCGADIVLLIASVLTTDECKRFAKKAHELGLETLLELHENGESNHIDENIDIVGINNRNLKTFEVNLEASIRLCHEIPNDYLKISESGISQPDTVVRLRKEGFQGFLMGENFMKTENPPLALKQFIEKVKHLQNQ